MELALFLVPRINRHRDAQMVVEVRNPILVSESHRETPEEKKRANKHTQIGHARNTEAAVGV